MNSLLEPTTGLSFSLFEFDIEVADVPDELNHICPTHLLPDERLGWCIGYACSVLQRRRYPFAKKLSVTMPEFLAYGSRDVQDGFLIGVKDYELKDICS